MKAIICALLLGQASLAYPKDIDKTEVIIESLLQIKNYDAVAKQMIQATGSKVTAEEFMEKLSQLYHQKDLQDTLKQAFFKHFSHEDIDNIYDLVTSETYKKLTKTSANFSLEASEIMQNLVVKALQIDHPKVSENFQPSKDSKVISLSSDNFENLISEKDTVIVDIYADWCGPCKALSPILNELSKESDHTFAKLNADTNRALLGKLNARGLPTLLFFKDGKEVGRQVGFTTKDKLNDLLVKYFGN